MNTETQDLKLRARARRGLHRVAIGLLALAAAAVGLVAPAAGTLPQAAAAPLAWMAPAVEALPQAAATPSAWSAYVANFDSNTVTPIDTATNTAGTPIPVGVAPFGVAITPNGQTAYVANNGDGTVTPINTATNTAGTPIPVGIEPIAVAITPNGKTAYVANYTSNTVTPIDTATNTPGTAIPVGGGPDAVAITPNGQTAYVTTLNGGVVTPIATATNTPGPSIPVPLPSFCGDEFGDYLPCPDNSEGIAITPNGQTAYVANEGYNADMGGGFAPQANFVTPIDTAANTTGAYIWVPSACTFSSPDCDFGNTSIAITPNGKTAYVTNAGGGLQSDGPGSITSFDTASNTTGASISVDGEPHGIAITPNGQTAYMTNQALDTVTPIDTATNTPGTAIPVGSYPQAVAVTPDQAPVAHLSVIPHGVGQPSSFDASASTVAFGTIASYSWNFGDGSTATTTSPFTTHTYLSPSTYTASVTETSSGGTSTTQVFTGQTMSQNGGPQAVASASVDVLSSTSNPASQTITFTAPASGSLGGSALLNPSASSGLAVSLSVDTSTTNPSCFLSGDTVNYLHGGSCVIDANQAGNADYLAAPQVQQTISIARLSQTITFTAPASGSVGVSAPLSPSASSGLAVSLSVDASTTNGSCSLSGDTLNYLHTGSCVIDANQAGNADYLAAPQVEQTISIGPGIQTITFTAPASGSLGGSAPLDPSASSGLAVSLSVDASTTNGSCSLSGDTVNYLQPGSCVIDANQAGDADYLAAPQVQQTITVATASQTITFTAPASGTVGGSTLLDPSASSGLAVSLSVDASTTNDSCSLSGDTVNYLHAGSCVIDANQAGDADYLAAPQVQQSVQVSQAPAATAVAAEGQDGAMWVQVPFLGAGWHSLGGQIIAAPAVVAVPQTSGPASPLFIATGTDHSLWVRSLSQNWTSLTPGVFTYCLDNPAAVVTGSASSPMLTVACEGGDHSLYYATNVHVPSSGLPAVTSWKSLGGALGAGPAVAPVNGVITYFVTASFNNGQVWTTTNGTDWRGTPWSCVGHPAAGIAQGGTTTFFGCQGTDGQLWAGPMSNVVALGGAITPGPGLGITSAGDFFFAEANFGGGSLWFRTTTADWADLGGALLNGVGAVGLN